MPHHYGSAKPVSPVRSSYYKFLEFSPSFSFFFEQFYGVSVQPYFSPLTVADLHLLAGHKSSIPYLTPDGGSRVPVSNNEKRGAQGSSVSLPVITKQFGIPIILPLAEYEAPGF